MSWTTGLNGIALSLWVGLDSYFFPLLILPLAVGLLGQLLLRVGTPTVLLLPILKVLTFLRQLSRRLLTLWVILFCYFGVLNLKATFSGGANLEDFGPLLLSTVHSLS
jgi:hypothetical protein